MKLSTTLLAAALTALPAAAQFQVATAGTQTSSTPTGRPDQVLLVNPSAQGAYGDIQSAVDAAPEGALILVKPGFYVDVAIDGKSLRIESVDPGTVQLFGSLSIRSIGPRQEVRVEGFLMDEGFEILDCEGEVSLVRCTAINDGVLVPPPPGVHFGNYPDCGIGLSRHNVINSAAVTLVDCMLAGRDGIRYPVCDGSPGEHALVVEDSRVTLYGGELIGGDGSDAPGCHGAYAGAGGDGVLARGTKSRVIACNLSGHGGAGGLDLEFYYNNGCLGELTRAQGGAIVEECSSDYVTFHIDSLVDTATIPSYTITGPPGADIFLMAGSRRGWREFTASEGVLHIGGPLTVFPLGTLSTSGTLTRPFPAPSPAWIDGYASLELQVYALVGGEDRYSEPRSLQVVRPNW